MIEPVRLHLAVPRWRAARHSLPMVEVAEHRSGHEIAGEPTLVVDARLRVRLAGLFDWVSIDRSWVHAERGPVVACRLIGETEAADSIILHAVIEAPDDLVELDRAWAGRGPAVSVVAASCLADRGWAAEWTGPLRALTRQVMLVDVELDRFAANLTTEGTHVASAIIEIGDASGSTRYAAALEVSDADLLWLYLGDEVAVNLFMQQVQLTPSITLDPNGAVAEPWLPVIRIVTTHLLATESFVDLNGLEGYL